MHFSILNVLTWTAKILHWYISMTFCFTSAGKWQLISQICNKCSKFFFFFYNSTCTSVRPQGVSRHWYMVHAPQLKPIQAVLSNRPAALTSLIIIGMHFVLSSCTSIRTVWQYYVQTMSNNESCVNNLYTSSLRNDSDYHLYEMLIVKHNENKQS